MTQKNLPLNGLLHATATVVYIILVSLLVFHYSQLTSQVPSVFNVATLLGLVVLSATIVGTLILGRPMLWYFNGAKTEAVKLFSYSVIWLLAFTVAFLVIRASII